MTHYSVDAAIEATRSAIQAMERIDRDICRVNKHHLAPFGLEARLAPDTDPQSRYYNASTFALNKEAWQRHLKNLSFLSRSQRQELTLYLGFEDAGSDWREKTFWESLDIIERIENNSKNYLKQTTKSVLDQLQRASWTDLNCPDAFRYMDLTGLPKIDSSTISIERTAANDLLDDLERIARYGIDGEGGQGPLIGSEIRTSMAMDFDRQKRLVRRSFESKYLTVFIYSCEKFSVEMPLVVAEFLHSRRTPKPLTKTPTEKPAVVKARAKAGQESAEQDERPQQGPSYVVEIKLGSDCGLTAEGDTKPHREIFKSHALSWFGPDLKWYVRGARGKPLTNELFVTAYELVKDLSREGVTVSLTIEGEHVFPVLGDTEKAPAIPIEPKLIGSTPVPEPIPQQELKPEPNTLPSAKVVQLRQPKAISESMPEKPKKLVKQGLKIVNPELKGYVHPRIALRELIREKLKKSCPQIRSSATTADGSFFVKFHAETLEPLTIRLGVNEVAIKERRSTILAAASEDPAQLYADLEASIKSYIAENLKPIEIAGEKFYASFRLDYFSVVDLSDRVNEPRTIPTGRQKMALIRAYNWAAGRGGKLQHLSYKEFVETLQTATGVRCHSYCAMD